jgi:PHP family Zn ribbon phosphoesterase
MPKDDNVYADRISNTGHYFPPRWTCCACCHELGNIGEGKHKCPNCGRSIQCTKESVPDFVTTLIKEGDEEE